MPEVGGVDLSKKVGPVPIWLIAVVGGVGLAWYVNRNMFGSGGSSDLPPESGVGGTPGGFVPAPIPGDTPEVPQGFLDNEAWAFAAVGWLIGNNYNPVEASVAVRKWLDGEKITARELAMITAVTKKPPTGIGLPPNIPVGGGVIPSPPSVPSPPKILPIFPIPQPRPPKPLPRKPAPSQGLYVVVTPWPTRRSTLSGIASEFLGNPNRWPEIWNHPRNVLVKRLRRQPNRIRAGDRFWVQR